jgi:aspartate 1-decarboxylase
MRRRMMKSKIHRATVTDANVDYIGSISIDAQLMELADIRSFEQVHVLDIDNGARLTTYAIAGRPGQIGINGAAAHLISTGDRVIVLAYADYEEAELEGFRPRIVHVDTSNRPVTADVAAILAADGAMVAGHIEGGPASPDG